MSAGSEGDRDAARGARQARLAAALRRNLRRRKPGRDAPPQPPERGPPEEQPAPAGPPGPDSPRR